MELDEKTRKWLVTGICLHTVISPVLRKFIEPTFDSLYQSLVASKGIDVQSYQNRLEWFGKRYLNYEGINNNRTNHGRDYKQYDYKVTNPVDLSKLFIETNITQYNGFHESCDSSALLNIIIYMYTDVPDFSSGLKCVAEQVRNDVRNGWAHPSTWDDSKFAGELALMANLIKQMGLPGTEESKTLEELDRWAQEGVEMIGGFSALDLVRELSKGIEKIENPDVQEVKTDLSKIQEEVNTIKRKMEDLEGSQTKFEKRVNKVEKGLETERDLRVLPEYQKEYIEDWRKDEETFLETKAANTVGERIKTQNIVVVTGSSGSGKSSIVHHIAFELQRTEKYDIIPVLEGPTDIIKHFHRGRKQVFVVDDVCGKEGICKPMVDMWLTHMEKLTTIFTSSCSTKLLVSCRLQIFHEKLFQCLVMFKDTECNLLSKDLRLSSTERVQMLAKYVKEEWVNDIDETMLNVDFLPLLCKLATNEKSKNGMINLLKHPVECISESIDYIIESDRVKCCVLVLCVLFEAGFDIEWLKTSNKSIDICKNLDTNVSKESVRNRIKENFRVLTGTYVKKIGSKYYIIHDMIYDIVLVKSGQNLPETFIKHAPVNVIASHFCFSDIQLSHTNLVIKLSNDYSETYFDRILDDLQSGNIQSMLHNAQLKSDLYRQKLTKHFSDRKEDFAKNLEMVKKCWKSRMDVFWGECMQRLWRVMIKTTVLTEVISSGYTDLVELMLNSGYSTNGFIPSENPLLLAIYYGYNDIVKLLLAYNADAIANNSFNCTPIALACIKKNKDAVRMLLEKTAILLQNKESPLHDDCMSTNILDVASLLLNVRYVVNAHDKNGQNPFQIALNIACLLVNVEVVRFLLKYNVDVTSNTIRQTPLHFACMTGNVDLVALLIENRADVKQCDYFRQAALHYACSIQNKDIVKLLVEYNADVTQCNKDGQTPLHIACSIKNKDIVKLLLEYEADVTHCNKDGQTPLHIACSNQQTIENLLYGYSAKVKKWYNDGRTLFFPCAPGNEALIILMRKHYASAKYCDKDENVDLVDMLLAHHADINQSDKDGKTPLYGACESKNVELVELLLENKADLKHCDKNGQTPLLAACLSSDEKVVKLLLDHKVDIAHCDKDGQTPLYAACKSDNVEVVKLLLQHNADVTQCDNDGQTVLYAACRSRNVEILKLLLEHNADVTHCDKDGHSVFFMTCWLGTLEIAKLLLQHMTDVTKPEKFGKSPLEYVHDIGYPAIIDLVCNHKSVKEKDQDVTVIYDRTS